jgi:hypothetical protein
VLNVVSHLAAVDAQLLYAPPKPFGVNFVLDVVSPLAIWGAPLAAIDNYPIALEEREPSVLATSPAGWPCGARSQCVHRIVSVRGADMVV